MKLLVKAPALLLAGVSCLAGCKSMRSTSTVTNTNTATASTAQTVAGTESPAPQPLTSEQSEARTLLEKGKELFRQDHDKEAAETFQKALDLDPDFAEAHFRLGLTYAAQGQKEKAEEEYARAVEAYKKHVRTNQKDADAFFNMGLAYAKLSKHDEAVKALRQAVKIETEDGDMYYELGTELSKIAQYQEAVAAFQKAIDLDPDNYRALEALDKAKEGAERIKVLQKRQEELLKKEAAKRANANGSNSNVPSAPAPVQLP